MNFVRYAPTINVDPQRKPPAKTEVSVVVKGPGVPLREGDLAVVDDVGRTWRSSTTFEDSYVMGHAPDTFPVGNPPLMLPALVHALVGIPVGSRVLVVIPFDSSWRRQLPAPVPIGDGALIPAWDTGLVGVKAGSRVLIVAPPDQGYGSSGAPRAGITATDTLVFVVDVLGAYNM